MPDVLLDTVTFVDYLTDRSRLDPEALQWIEGAEQEHSLLISAVTIMQLVEMRTAGTLSGEALDQLDIVLAKGQVGVESITLAVARSLGAVPGGVGLADRIVGATAVVRNVLLLTANPHLRMDGVHVVASRTASLSSAELDAAG
jgi:predicted nucleic acid-binding protein